MKLSQQDQQYIRDICLMIQAGTVLGWLVTDEERRALWLLASAEKTTGRRLLAWRSTTGIVDRKGRVFEGTAHPIDALNFAERDMERCVYVLLDLHQFLTPQSGLQGGVLVRKLKDACHSMSTTQSSVFVVGCEPTPPKELKDFAHVIEMTLPTSETIQNQLIQGLADRGASDLNSQEVRIISDHLVGLTLQQAEDVLVREVVSRGKLTVASLPAIHKAKKELVRQTCGLEYIDQDDGLVSVGGMPNIRKWLRLIRPAFTGENIIKASDTPRGMLLLGPAGVGKSLEAKAAAKELGLVLLRINMGGVFASLMGESEANFRRLRRAVDSFGEVAVWMDEMEKQIQRGRGELDSGVSSRVAADFLTWSQERLGKVFFIATANDVEAIPPEFLRGGRLFTKVWFVDLPRKEDRMEIFRIHLSLRKARVKESELDALAERSEGYTGSEIEEVVTLAFFLALDDKKPLSEKHLLEALPEVTPISRLMPDKIAALREWARDKASLA
jgi:hypothetical protein